MQRDRLDGEEVAGEHPRCLPAKKCRPSHRSRRGARRARGVASRHRTVLDEVRKPSLSRTYPWCKPGRPFADGPVRTASRKPPPNRHSEGVQSRIGHQGSTVTGHRRESRFSLNRSLDALHRFAGLLLSSVTNTCAQHARGSAVAVVRKQSEQGGRSAAEHIRCRSGLRAAVVQLEVAWLSAERLRVFSSRAAGGE
jgi:hypothetical protein